MAGFAPASDEDKKAQDFKKAIAAEHSALIMSGSVYMACYIQRVTAEALIAQQVIYDSYKRREVEMELLRKQALNEVQREKNRQRMRRLEEISQLVKERQQLEGQHQKKKMQQVQHIRTIGQERCRVLQQIQHVTVLAKRRKRKEEEEEQEEGEEQEKAV
jgi:hypothetical protein